MKLYHFTNFLAFIIGNRIKHLLLIFMIVLCSLSAGSYDNGVNDMLGIYKTDNRRIYRELKLLPGGKCMIHACVKHETFCLRDSVTYYDRHNYIGKWEKLGDTIQAQYELNEFIANLGLRDYIIQMEQMDTVHRKLHISEHLARMVDWISINYILYYDVDVINNTKYYIINDSTLEEQDSCLNLLFYKVK